jgi:hypothetical protein
MKDLFKVIGAVIFLLGILSIGPILRYKNYQECRAHEFSRFFCVTH